MIGVGALVGFALSAGPDLIKLGGKLINYFKHRHSEKEAAVETPTASQEQTQKQEIETGFVMTENMGCVAERDMETGEISTKQADGNGIIDAVKKVVNVEFCASCLERGIALLKEKAMAAKKNVTAATDFVAGKAGQIAGQSAGRMIAPQLAEEAGVTM